ncbi:hypothetical protein L226DRAFT_608127 [Lentinus tigrinus ALCF2SS1-7]|uniref:SWR1-complex protein 4 n=1 Tax=Lentinus tigrinus ALCF2SS1-6 TaxID=1328759 RepID=A0A5C2SUV5_9APHY|nr:hypothetical protein L227DRAFT_648009 [Lentinus tigrinus ALCF2SS1-6]RPD80785.1 hypothetical protein L226DRAFT_608127 [Lentinus tigrinus ALCF2SS1-7]
MAASAADVRSILAIPEPPAAGSSQPAKKPQGTERAKKPEGIPRELYALIGPHVPTLTAQFTKPRLKQKPNLAGGGRVKWHVPPTWEWRPFKNGARSDGLRLSHWTKAGTDPETDYQFAKYNIQGTPYVYTHEEYTRLLDDSSWTKEETDYLFNLVREYDGRFYVVHDRYEYPNGPQRSLEDLKERYFGVCRRLIRNRPWIGDEASKKALLDSLTFDKDREVARKDYVASLEHRTPEQITEEDALYLELEKLKENERRFRKDRDELLRTLCGIESGLPDIQVDEDGLAGATFDTKKKKKGVAGSVEPQTPVTPSANTVIALPQPQPKKTSAKSAAYGASPATHLLHLEPTIVVDALHCIVRTEVEQTSSSTKAAHVPVHLRSYKIAQPKAALAPRVTQVLSELGISHSRLVMPTRDNLTKFAALIDAAQQLVEIKKAVDKHDQDIQTTKARLAALRGETVEDGDVPQTPMDVDEGAVDAEGEVDGRAQSVVSTRSVRSRKQGRRSMSVSSVDTTGGPNKRQKQR